MCDSGRTLRLVGHLVLIAGGSASGKSTIAAQVRERFAHARVWVMSHDEYYRDVSQLSGEDLARHNFDHPDALDHARLVSDVTALLAGKRITLPRYDYVTHARSESADAVGPLDMLIVEGIFALHYEELVKLAGLRMYVEADADLRLARRLRRDLRERGFGLDEALDNYLEKVRPMHDAFVEPSRRRADLIVPGDRPADGALRMLDGYLLNTLVEETIRERVEADERSTK